MAATNAFSADEPALPTNTVRWAKGRLLVQPRAGLSDHQFDLILRPHLARRMGRLAVNLNIQIIELPEGVDEMTVAKALRRNPHFKFVEPDRVRPPAFSPNDPTYPSEWHEAKIGAPAAWDYSTGQGVTIAILDSGVDSTHPDLVNAVVPGWNFYDNNGNAADVYGHGTKVAGAAAASGNNAIGVAGVAWSSKIMPIRVTDTQGFAYDSMIIQGLTWAVDQGARVANVSFLGITDNPAIVSAAQYMRSKGGVVVTSAGNDGVLETFPPSDAITSVSATDTTDTRPSWSSYGNYIDVGAPGVSIYTTVQGGGYGATSGTSFSAPITAGVYALMISANPSLSPSMLDDALFSTAVDVGTTGWDQYYGWGRIDAFAAVNKARQTGVSDTQAPSVAITSPVSGTVQGLVPVDVAAKDNVGVTRVELRVNGVLNASDSTVPYAFTWDTTTYANGTYTLQAVAYDAAGNHASSTPVTLTVANGAISFLGFLSGTGVASAASVNLTTTGTVDWAKWPNYIHKVLGGSQISNYALIGTGSVASYTNDPRTVTWSDGTPTASGSDKAGISIAGIGNGFKITVPADTTARTLSVYVGGSASGGKLVVHLSDASVADYTDTAFSSTGQYDAVYTLTYQAASAGQQLVVSWTQASGSGNVALQGAALAPAPTGPSTPTGVSASDGTSTTSVTVTWTASTNATSYTVYRSTVAGQLGTSVGTTNTTSLTDASVTPGTLYYYSVVAVGAGGKSVSSAQDSGYAAVPPPLPPTGVSASDGTSNTSVTIQWVASASATSYTVYRSTTSGQLGTSIGTTSTTTLTDTTVTPGVTYYYSVTATGVGGTSAASAQNSGFASSASPTIANFSALGTATGKAASQTVASAPPPTANASLAGSSTVSSATVNITQAGSADWAKWPNYVHKATGGSQISTAVRVGSVAPQSYTNDARTVVWSDGTPTASGSDQAGLSVTGVGSGFLITAPADTTSRTLNVYVGGSNSSGLLIAHLSDGSAPDYVTKTTPVTGRYDLVYTIAYRAASNGQQLSVNWSQVSGSGNVTLQGAALK